MWKRRSLALEGSPGREAAGIEVEEEAEAEVGAPGKVEEEVGRRGHLTNQGKRRENKKVDRAHYTGRFDRSDRATREPEFAINAASGRSESFSIRISKPENLSTYSKKVFGTFEFISRIPGL
jgi:hypothetical protein